MNARLRRLSADYEQVRKIFADHPYIRLVKAEGTPPEKYTFTLLVKGLVPAGEDSFVPGDSHQAEIFLPLDYPRRPPFCRMLTPVFHPNIDPQKICIGDHWSAGQSLAQMIVHIAQMICYQGYNLKSPLNARAAAWAEQHLSTLPLQPADLSVGL
jgi:ubiquitin-protein ligase